MFRLLGSGPSGLCPTVARKRLKTVGFNSMQDSTTESAMRLLLPQFGSPLGLILVFAAAVSLVVRELVEAIIVMAIVLASSLLAVSQEYRASRAVDALKSRLEIKARVLRGGREVRVPVRRNVPGDVILMSAGTPVTVVDRRGWNGSLLCALYWNLLGFPRFPTPTAEPVRNASGHRRCLWAGHRGHESVVLSQEHLMTQISQPWLALARHSISGGIPGFASGSGSSVIVASVSRRTLATETAFIRAMRTTLVGSMMPTSTRST